MKLCNYLRQNLDLDFVLALMGDSGGRGCSSSGSRRRRRRGYTTCGRSEIIIQATIVLHYGGLIRRLDVMIITRIIRQNAIIRKCWSWTPTWFISLLLPYNVLLLYRMQRLCSLPIGSALKCKVEMISIVVISTQGIIPEIGHRRGRRRRRWMVKDPEVGHRSPGAKRRLMTGQVR